MIENKPYSFYWVGYLKTEFLEKVEYRSTYDISVVATDGISDFNGYLSPTTALNLDSGITVLAQIINDSFKDGLPISESVRVFETRMDHGVGDSLFEQFTVQLEAFIEDDNNYEDLYSRLKYKPSKSLLNALETILSSWICRVFQWDGVWYIIRIWEYRKGNLTLNNFDKTGVRTGNNSLTLNQDFDCLGNVVRRGETGFTRFDTNLKLGALNRPETMDVLVEDFSNSSFESGRPLGSTAVLRKWEYINSQVWVPVVGRENEYAGVERVTESYLDDSFIRFWGTADGLSDTNLSSVKWNNHLYSSAVQDADVLSINAKFRVKRRGSGDSLIPLPNTHVVAMEVKVGIYYLEFDGSTTFSWTTTPTLVTFPVDNSEVFNDVVIKDIVVPATGEVEFSLMQLITISGTRHRYVVDWEDININISRNDALTYNEIKAKAITDSKHSNQFKNRETFIGDSVTNLSTSALILKDVAETPVSVNWFREEVESESEPLLSIVLSDMVNMFGKNNYMLTATIKESDAGKGFDFRKGLQYKGKDFVLTSASLDDRSGIWKIQAFQLSQEGEIAT